MTMKKRIVGAVFGMGALLAAPALVFAPAPAAAQDEEEEDGRRRRSETLDPAVARVLQEVFELQQAEQYAEAKGKLNELLRSRGERMKAFDKSTSYEILGSIEAAQENFPGALRAFQTALNTGGLPETRNNQLRYFIAQLNVQLENYDEAIRGLNQWIQQARAAGQAIDPNAYYLLAAANVQKQPPNYRAAVGPAEQVIELRGAENKKSDYDLLNLVYSELGENTKRAALLERMINAFPSEQSYWSQLAGLYSQLKRDDEAFSVLEVAYRAGLIEREGQIITLVNYYSFFENPYRGAKLLSREMEAGRVKTTQSNLVLLSQLWSQSREHKRAIPVLERAAQQSDSGELSYRLGQVLLADEKYARAERALVTALNKGGMTSRQTGDAWLLLGTARFSQAGPGDRGRRRDARAAFVNATRYSSAAQQARDWVTYIDAINDTERRQDELERAQRIEAVEENIKRLRTQLQVCRLQGGEECEGIDERLASEQETLASLRGGAQPAGEDASTDGGDGSSAEDESEEDEASSEDGSTDE